MTETRPPQPTAPDENGHSPDALNLYLDIQFSDTPGYAHLATGRAHRLVSGRIEMQDWTETTFTWPGERDRLVAEIRQSDAAGFDVYLATMVLSGQKRTKGTAVNRSIIHADVDGDIDVDRVAELGGHAVASGTGYHGHVYVVLDRAVDEDTYELLCRGLRHNLGAKDAKVCDNDVLRPPGTHNHKAAGGPQPVVWLVKPSGQVWEPGPLALELGGAKETAPKTGQFQGDIDADHLPALIRKALAEVTGDRSADTYRILYACADNALTLAEARAVLNLRDDLCNRLAPRRDDDVAVCWLKIDETRRLSWRDREPPPDGEPPAAPPPPAAGAAGPAEELDVILASDVVIRRVVYLWEARVPLGALTLLPGEEGIGKTLLGIRAISDLTHGQLSGEFYGTPQKVLIVAPEDGIEDVFTPRLREAGADLTRVMFIRSRKRGEQHDRVILPRDLKLLADKVAGFGAKLVWIDSVVTTLPDDVKTINYKQTADVLRELSEWADRQRIAIAGPWHINKGTGRDPAARMMDSRAFRTAVRSLLMVVRDPDAADGVLQGIVVLNKANAGPTINVDALRYRVRSAPYVVEEVDEQTGEIREVKSTVGVADWAGIVAGDSQEIVRNALGSADEQPDGAARWLRQYLTDVGPTERATVMKAAEEAEFSKDQIKRAFHTVHVVSKQVSGSHVTDGKRVPFRHARWSLPTRPEGHTDE